MIWLVVGLYFVAGSLALSLFELFTHRLSRNFEKSVDEGQKKILDMGSFSPRQEVKWLLIGEIALFWPFVFIGRIGKGNDDDKEEESEGYTDAEHQLDDGRGQRGHGIDNRERTIPDEPVSGTDAGPNRAGTKQGGL